VGNLSFQTEDRDLREFFASSGDVTDAKVIMDRNTGRSKGFGFVTFSSADGPTEAKKKSGEDLQGRNIRIEFASENPPERTGGGGGGGGGGYRGGGGGGGYGGGGGGGGGGYRGGGGDRGDRDNRGGGGGGGRDQPYERRGGGGGGGGRRDDRDD